MDPDEAGNEIIEAIFDYADGSAYIGAPPATIQLPTKLEGHPAGWIDDISQWPGLFVVPIVWPSNRKVAKQYEHIYSCTLFVVVPWTEQTSPYAEARKKMMIVRRNIAGSKADSGHYLGLEYIADMEWRSTQPENEFSRFLRENGLRYACASIDCAFTAWSEEDSV